LTTPIHFLYITTGCHKRRQLFNVFISTYEQKLDVFRSRS